MKKEEGGRGGRRNSMRDGEVNNQDE